MRLQVDKKTGVEKVVATKGETGAMLGGIYVGRLLKRLIPDDTEFSGALDVFYARVKAHCLEHLDANGELLEAVKRDATEAPRDVEIPE